MKGDAVLYTADTIPYRIGYRAVLQTAKALMFSARCLMSQGGAPKIQRQDSILCTLCLGSDIVKEAVKADLPGIGTTVHGSII